MTGSQEANHEISTGQVRLSAHRYEGNGPEMILIHGIGSSSGDFDPVINQLTEFCHPITFDLRGHGESDAPSHGYHYSDYVRDLNKLISQMELKRPIVLGHSLGGIIAMFWAIQNPDGARGIIIEDSPLRSGEEFRESFEGWLTLNALPVHAVRAWYAEKNASWSDAVLDQRALDMTRTTRAAIQELYDASMSNDGLDTAAQLGAITAPMLFMHGDVDQGSMVHPEDIATLPARIPQVQIQWVRGSGHTIHRSQPDVWLQHVRTFINGLPQG